MSGSVSPATAAPTAAQPAGLALQSTPAPARAKLSAAAKQFEAIFVRQMLAEARKASFGDDLMGSSAQDTFRQMQDEKFADIAADKGVFGLAAAVERQLAGRIAPTTAATATATTPTASGPTASGPTASGAKASGAGD